jgi:hypothetical protein
MTTVNVAYASDQNYTLMQLIYSKPMPAYSMLEALVNYTSRGRKITVELFNSGTVIASLNASSFLSSDPQVNKVSEAVKLII